MMMTIDFEEQQRKTREAYTSGLRMAVAAIPYTSNRAERARRLGISTVTLDRWVKGESFPTEYHLHKLSAASRWPVECIREGRIPTTEELG